MTFTEIVRYIADRFNLKSDEQLARVGTEVNMRHREILSSLGVSQVTEQTTAAATTTPSSRYLTFGPSPVAVVKILAVYNTALGTYPPPILDEVSPDQLLNMGVCADPPTHYAVTNMGERTVTIKLNSIPATAYALTADVEGNATQLSGALSPSFSEDYHDILVNMVSADELELKEKYDKAKEKLKQAEMRMGVFRLFIAKSAYKEMKQGGRSSSTSSGSGGGGAVSGWPALTSPAIPLAIGDLLVATATTAVGSLADVAAGQVLASGGIGVAPAYTSSPTLTALTLVTPLSPTSGGTGVGVYVVGDLLYASTTTALSKLADVATGQVLASGGVGVAPAWSATPTLTRITIGAGSAATPAIIVNSGAGFWSHSSGYIEMSNSGTTSQAFFSSGIVLRNTGIYAFCAGDPSALGADGGLSRLGAASLAIGNGTTGDFSGALKLTLLNIAAGGSTTISTGVGSVKMSTANPATNTAWIPIQYAGSTYYVPAWTTNSP